jgi:hypothetical protein
LLRIVAAETALIRPPGSPVSDRLFMPLSSTKLALRARRRSGKGVELELDVDARCWPAIAAVVG